MKRASKKATQYMLIGFVPITPLGPSLGTPIFRLPDEEGEYIQCSSRERKIESLIELPEAVSHHRSFIRVRPNEGFNCDHDFIIGFRDKAGVSQAYTKKGFLTKFRNEFSEYDDLPFLQWNVISCFDAPDLILRLSDKNVEKIVTSQYGDPAKGRRLGNDMIIRFQLPPDLELNINKFFSDTQRNFRNTFIHFSGHHSSAEPRLVFSLDADLDLQITADANPKNRNIPLKKFTRSMQEALLRSVLDTQRRKGRSPERRAPSKRSGKKD